MQEIYPYSPQGVRRKYIQFKKSTLIHHKELGGNTYTLIHHKELGVNTYKKSKSMY